jgi:hypothetical protein
MGYFKNQLEREVWEKKMEGISQEKDLNEADIKNILAAHYATNDPKLLTCTERNIKGTNEHPFDFVVGDTRYNSLELMGFEIKGDTDNYSRLDSQLRAYEFVFDRIFIVLHKKKIPETLPDWVGVLRVFEDGTLFCESTSYLTDPFDISTDYEWDTFLSENGLSIKPDRLKAIVRKTGEIRKKLIFNRFFAVSAGLNTHKYDRFFPLTESEKEFLIGLSVEQEYKGLVKDIAKLQNKIDILKKVVMMGQTTLPEE